MQIIKIINSLNIKYQIIFILKIIYLHLYQNKNIKIWE